MFNLVENCSELYVYVFTFCSSSKMHLDAGFPMSVCCLKCYPCRQLKVLERSQSAGGCEFVWIRWETVPYILTLSIASELINYQAHIKWFWIWMLQKQMCFINLLLCQWMSWSKVYWLGTGMENKGAHKALVIELGAKNLCALGGI